MKSKSIIAVILAALSLAACAHRGAAPIDMGDDDTFCRQHNVQAGSPEYVACRKDRDVQRSNAVAKSDDSQRKLADYMLNNPVRP